MDVFDEDLLNFWRCLNKHDVKYILVGGFATNFHGYSRFTSDLNIWIKDSKENRKNLRKAYAESGNGDLKEIETIEFIAGWTTLYIAGNMELDIMTKLVGFEQIDFDMCYEEAPIATVTDVNVKFLHLNHLLTEKLAANRKKDLLDVEELKRINNIHP
ncbi:MAG: hypothetical protein ACOYMA_14955 [Bacteroidia bacterium]